MDIASLLTPDVFAFVLMPILIFLARICDVSIGTVRIIFISRGKRLLAPLLGFFEVLIWLLAIGQIMNNYSNPISYISYSAGFAAGTFIGMLLEEKLAMGVLLIRIITKKDHTELMKVLKSAEYEVTSSVAEDAYGKVNIIYTVIKRGYLKDAASLINTFDSKAYYSIEDLRTVSKSFPIKKHSRKKFNNLFRRFHRKGK